MRKHHTIMGGKVSLFKRPNSDFWQCCTYLAGRQHRKSTREESLSLAKEFAEDWYLGLRGKLRDGELVARKNEKRFAQAAELFEREYEIITDGERNRKHVEDHYARLRNHLIPYFGKLGLSEVTAGKVQDYRMFRLNADQARVPSRSTMLKEISTLSQVLKTAIRHGWLERLPDLSRPYRASAKVSHRAWFSPEQYKQLYEATRDHAKAAKGTSWQWAAEQLHDYVLFMVNTGIRPDEANNLEYRDVEIVQYEEDEAAILEIEVRGKRGVGYCMSMPGAVRPFQRLVARNQPKPTDCLFPANHKKQFNRILEREHLKFDWDGNRRTAYSLRHTYICLRLLEGADIYQIAKNCRISVEMIEKHYATHIKDRIDHSKVNVRNARKRKVLPRLEPDQAAV